MKWTQDLHSLAAHENHLGLSEKGLLGRGAQVCLRCLPHPGPWTQISPLGLLLMTTGPASSDCLGTGPELSSRGHGLAQPGL